MDQGQNETLAEQVTNPVAAARIGRFKLPPTHGSTPIDNSFLHFPADHYAHPKAPTEWWWHTGTLSADDRIFGFEINATRGSHAVGDKRVDYAFTQLMLTDVQEQRHYSATTVHLPPPLGTFDPSKWAASDAGQEWFVRLGDPTSTSYVSMKAPKGDPTRDMHVAAVLHSSGEAGDATGTVEFDLVLSQRGAPLLVWGTGVAPLPPPPPELATSNFYYSLTRLGAIGTITIDGELLDTTGTTWMDHEYGFFGDSTHPPTWLLQNMQLDNGMCISNFRTGQPVAGTALDSLASLQQQDGRMFFVNSKVTVSDEGAWTSPLSHNTYFQKAAIELPDFDAEFVVKSLMPSQEFYTKTGSVYEGVATVQGTFAGSAVTGTAWMEQTA